MKYVHILYLTFLTLWKVASILASSNSIPGIPAVVPRGLRTENLQNPPTRCGIENKFRRKCHKYYNAMSDAFTEVLTSVVGVQRTAIQLASNPDNPPHIRAYSETLVTTLGLLRFDPMEKPIPLSYKDMKRGNLEHVAKERDAMIMKIEGAELAFKKVVEAIHDYNIEQEQEVLKLHANKLDFLNVKELMMKYFDFYKVIVKGSSLKSIFNNNKKE